MMGMDEAIAEVRRAEEMDRDRKVTLTIGQLTDALAEALKVVADAKPQWTVGDRAYVEVHVTWVSPSGCLTQCAIGDKPINGFISTDILQEIA
jgi:hypothetical protein